VANNKFGLKIRKSITTKKPFRKNMMSLLANMDLKNLKDNILAKANNGIEFFILLLKQEAIQSRR